MLRSRSPRSRSLQLVEAGKVELDAPVRRYLPWFEVADADASAMTVRQLLHHTGGLPASAGYQPIFGIDTSPGARAGVRAPAYRELDRPLGSEYEYCNANYNTLGLIVRSPPASRTSATSPSASSPPLEMRTAFAALAPRRPAGLAPATADSSHGSCLARFPYPPSFLPCGFLMASAEDMAHFAVAQPERGLFSAASVLSPAGVDAMHKEWPGSRRGASWLRHGLGDAGSPTASMIWRRDTGHFHSEVMLDPAGRWGVVTLVNGSHWLAGQRFETLATGVLSLLVGRTCRTTTTSTA